MSTLVRNARHARGLSTATPAAPAIAAAVAAARAVLSREATALAQASRSTVAQPKKASTSLSETSSVSSVSASSDAILRGLAAAALDVPEAHAPFRAFAAAPTRAAAHVFGSSDINAEKGEIAGEKVSSDESTSDAAGKATSPSLTAYLATRHYAAHRLPVLDTVSLQHAIVGDMFPHSLVTGHAPASHLAAKATARASTTLLARAEAAAEPPVKPKTLFYMDVVFGENKRADTGQFVPPEETTSSPTVRILVPPTELAASTNDKEANLYTLALVDLDHAHLSTKSLRQYTHWLVCNIPIHSRIVIPSQPCEYLEEASMNADTASTQIGDTVIPYLPIIPPKQRTSNPNRYVLVLLKQNQGRVAVEDFKDATKLSPKVLDGNLTPTGTPQPNSTYLGPGEEAIAYLDRFRKPIWSLVRNINMDVAAYGVFLSRWTQKTPALYSRLNLHEPVFAPLPKLLNQFNKKVAHIIAKPTDTPGAKLFHRPQAPRLLPSRGTVPKLDAALRGIVAPSTSPTHPYEEMVKQKQKAPLAYTANKTKNVGVLAAVGMVKRKANDIASRV